MAFVGVILKACSPVIATLACMSFSNSTKEMPGRASTILTSLNPGNCWKSMLSIWLFVAGGRFWTKRILLGGSVPLAPCNEAYARHTQAVSLLALGALAWGSTQFLFRTLALDAATLFVTAAAVSPFARCCSAHTALSVGNLQSALACM